MANDILITHIKGLAQVRAVGVEFLAGAAMGELPVISNSYLHISKGLISDFGKMEDLPVVQGQTLDASGCFVFPSFVDSHTHLVFAASREEEFVMDELLEKTLERANEIIHLGTGAVEIKSGYGLTLKDELKMLRVAKRIGKETPLTVKTTFLGAHAVPSEMKKEDYVKLVIEEMIPAVAEEKLADYIDVFCEEGFFTISETEQVVEAGKKFGMKPRIHANQLHNSGGVQVGVKTGALSVDHLENIGDEEIRLLKKSPTMPTALPCAAFFLNLPMPPARKMIDEGLPLAIASDYNPGSSPSGNMQTMLSLACIKMKMTPEEVFNAATINTAFALELSLTHGTITRGKVANVFITKQAPSIAYFPYHFGNNFVDRVILNGQLIN
ncbi:MAG: imidazolonepropionase [Bacteroidetes bacterium]|nr:imidazolonepropionase [Bacteroidota bacterium]